MAKRNNAFGAAARCLTLSVLAALASCAPLVDLGGQNGPPARIFDVSISASNLAAATLNTPSVILVEEPTASSVLDKDRVAVRLDGGEIQYLSGMRFADKPGRLIRRAIKNELDTVNGLTALGRGALDIPSDFRLKLLVQDFQVTKSSIGQESTVVSLQALLIDARGNLMGSRTFDQSESISATAPAIVMAGLSRSLSAVITDLGAWVLESIDAQNAA